MSLSYVRTRSRRIKGIDKEPDNADGSFSEPRGKWGAPGQSQAIKLFRQFHSLSVSPTSLTIIIWFIFLKIPMRLIYKWKLLVKETRWKRGVSNFQPRPKAAY